MSSSKPLRVSVVVPVLNEERRIGRLLDGLSALLPCHALHEVIIVDGGSSDRTAELASTDPRATFLRSERGRARQMNRGAGEASGDVIWFVHADGTPPPEALFWIERTLADPAVVAGAFQTWTVVDDGEVAPRWAPLLHLADLRSRWSDRPYGDQAMFIRKEVFFRLGGFADLPIMEDLDLSERLRAAGRVVTVPSSVEVSGRRFLARPVYATFIVNVLPMLHRWGISIDVLADLYDLGRRRRGGNCG